MLYREIIAVCSGTHTKHINTLCGQNVELLNVLHIVTTGLYRVLGLNSALPTTVRVATILVLLTAGNDRIQNWR